MSPDSSRRWRTALSTLAALALGGLVGTALVVGFQFADAALAEKRLGTFLVPPIAQAELAAGFGLVAALVIGVSCAPLWLLLAKFRLDKWYMAGALGFGATMAYWVIQNSTSGWLHTIAELTRSGLPLAICGGIAGLVTWWVGRRTSSAQSSSSS